MCCCNWDCDPDFLMMMLCCITNKNKKFLVRCIIGFLFDGFECLSLEFKKRNENKYLISSMAIVYVIFLVRTFYCYCRGKDVYKFNYIFLFKLISLGVAFVIFYTTSSFNWDTIEQLYIHFKDWEFQKMFLTIMNTVSLLDMILNFSSLVFLILKITRAAKRGKNTSGNPLFQRFDRLGKSDNEACEGPNQQVVFSVNVNDSGK